MRITAIEKYFVNRPGHTQRVASRPQRLLGGHLIRSAGFPSTSALDSRAAWAGLVRIHHSQQPGQVDMIRLKKD